MTVFWLFVISAAVFAGAWAILRWIEPDKGGDARAFSSLAVSLVMYVSGGFGLISGAGLLLNLLFSI